MIVPDDQLSLAIGREGQNARLAARLTGWRVDIRSETEFSKQETEGGYERGGPRTSAAAATRSSRNGRRCPNAALPSSRYCGLDSHQALRGQGHRRRRRKDLTGARSTTVVARGAASAPRGRRCAASLPWRAGSCPIRTARLPGRGAWVHPITRLLRRRGRPPRLPARLPGARDHPRGHRRLHTTHGQEARPRASQAVRHALRGGHEAAERLRPQGQGGGVGRGRGRGRARAHRQAAPKQESNGKADAAASRAPPPADRHGLRPPGDRDRRASGSPSASSASRPRRSAAARRAARPTAKPARPRGRRRRRRAASARRAPRCRASAPPAPPAACAAW